MKDKENILPCPFCGESAPVIEHLEGTILHPAYVVRCDNCGAQAPWSDRGDHIEMWNQRVSLASAPVADMGNPLSDSDIRDVLLAHGFTIKDGQTDLKPYVYEAARALISVARIAADADKALEIYAARESAPVAGEATPEDYVQLVPEHCDRIVWKGRYYALPLDAAPQASEADPLQGAADWLMRAFEPPLSASDLARQLVIGYNRATRLRDAALSAQPGAQRTGGSDAE